jgi:integrase
MSIFSLSFEFFSFSMFAYWYLTSMASVHLKGKDSQFYHAYFSAWDAEEQRWKQRSKSTFCAEMDSAMEVARQYERLAKLAGPGGVDDQNLRHRVFETLRSIVELSGRSASEGWVEFAEAWLEVRARRVKAATRKTYRAHIRNFTDWLGEKAGSTAMGSITLEVAQGFYDHLVKGGNSPKTAKMNVNTMGMIMERAVAAGQAVMNPFPQVERVIGAKREREPFTLPEVGRLIAACYAGDRTGEHAEDWHTMILLGLCTGARLGDCARMTGAMISRVGDHEVLAWQPGKKTDSAGEGRTIRIPLIEPLAGRLKSLKRKKGPLCPSLYETGVSTRWGLSPQFRRLVEDAGIEMTEMVSRGVRGNAFRSKVFHSLRHTLNSLMFNADVPQEWRMRVMDHESAAVNEGYTHADVSEMARWMGRIDLGEIGKGSGVTGQG